MGFEEKFRSFWSFICFFLRNCSGLVMFCLYWMKISYKNYSGVVPSSEWY